VLQAQSLELVLGLGAQCVGAGSPEARDGCANGSIVGAGIGVDVAGVGDLALGSRVDAVDLGAREGLEARDAKLLGECVDAGVLEELVAAVVDRGDRGVRLEDALAGELLREVFASVEEFEEASDSVDVVVWELDLTRLRGVNGLNWLYNNAQRV
jgi:hypothetical protein